MRVAFPGVLVLLALSAGPVPLLAQTVTDPNLSVTPHASGLNQPTAMGFIGQNEILVLQRGGLVRRVIGGMLQAGNVLDLVVSNTSGDRGALGLTIDPDFVHNGFVYVYYSESSTGVDGGTPAGMRLYRHRWDGAALVEPFLVLDLPVFPGPNHNGGTVLFGPDDNLYLMIGDLNRQEQLQNFPNGNPPDDSSVIFRVNRAGAGLPDNPLVNPLDPDDPLNRYLGYGVRNGFGMDFDPVTGDLWDSENGPSSYDEVNRVEPGSNSGWRRIMGPDARDPQGISDLWHAPGSFYSDPEFSWEDPVAPTAVAFADSRLLGCGNVNRLFVGDVNCGQLYRFELTADRAALTFTDPNLSSDLVADNGGNTCADEQAEIIFGSGFGVVTDMQNGPDGLLYVLSLSQGTIYRIGPAGGGITDADNDLVEAGCDCDDTDPGAFADPAEVPLVRLSGGSPAFLGWDSQAGTAGGGTSYAVVSGNIADLRADGDFSSACTLTSGLTDPDAIDSRLLPLPGDGFYFLVQAVNGCSDGTFGDGTLTPDGRDALDAALPPPC